MMWFLIAVAVGLVGPVVGFVLGARWANNKASDAIEKAFPDIDWTELKSET